MAKVRVTISTLDGEVLDTFFATSEREECKHDDDVFIGGAFAGSSLSNAVWSSLKIVQARKERDQND